jgi:hypothetical protein
VANQNTSKEKACSKCGHLINPTDNEFFLENIKPYVDLKVKEERQEVLRKVKEIINDFNDVLFKEDLIKEIDKLEGE